MKEKEIQQKLIKKENDIVREVMIYCAEHNIQFSREHNKLVRIALRKFFTDGIYPIVRDLFDVNIKDYHND